MEIKSSGLWAQKWFNVLQKVWIFFGGLAFGFRRNGNLCMLFTATIHHPVQVTVPLTFFFLLAPAAQASCAAIVRTAKHVVEDVGVNTASKATGLVELSTKSEKNADRDCHNLLVKRHGLALPIPQTRLDTGEHGKDETIPLLRLRDWARYLVNSDSTHMLVGLKKPDHKREAAILQAFWENYRRQEPSHPVFGMAERGELSLQTCIPMALHGDEGRGRKRTAFLVLNFHGLLGRGLRLRCKTKNKKVKAPWLKMRPNFHGHTMTNRFLFAALPKALYTGDHWYVWDSLLSAAAEDATYMTEIGVEDKLCGRGKFTMVTLAICGDWPWLADSGSFARSYRTCPKHVSRTKPCGGICHMCAAGRPNVDFEQLNTSQPAWRDTMCSLPLGDPADDPSPFCNVPHPPGKAAMLWQWDTFHTWHLGVAKYFLSSFVAVLSQLEPQGSVDDRFESLSQSYLQHCKSGKRRPHVTKLTKELFGWSTTSTFPCGSWHKADLSTSLMSWVLWRFVNEGHGWPEMAKLAGETAVLGDSWLKTLYNSETWMHPRQSHSAATFGLGFLRNYCLLAKMAWEQKQNLWVIQPKLHAMHHLAIYMFEGSAKGIKILNSLSYSCQQDEDFIGRPARLARRVTAHPAHVSKRVIERYLQCAYHHWLKDGFLIRPKPGKKKWRETKLGK